MPENYQAGEPVVYRLTKFSSDPGPRARLVKPAPHGESYQYVVDKFWTVREVRPNGDLVLVTRRGKEHVVSGSDPLLRRANWWERWWHGERFPKLTAPNAAPASSPDRMAAESP